MAEYTKLPHAKALRCLATKKCRESFPEKTRARYDTRNAVRTGKLLRPNICSKCPSTAEIEAHHEDYSKPLEIIWLCPACHHDEHKRIRDSESSFNE
jgi:hypothetical protein